MLKLLLRIVLLLAGTVLVVSGVVAGDREIVLCGCVSFFGAWCLE